MSKNRALSTLLLCATVPCLLSCGLSPDISTPVPEEPSTPSPAAPQPSGASPAGDAPQAVSLAPEHVTKNLQEIDSFANTTDTPFMDMASGDLDGDGDSDLVFAGDTGGMETRVVTMTNDGQGHYSTKNIAQLQRRHIGIAHDSDFSPLTLTDIDGDGDLDIVLVTLRDGGSRLVVYKIVNHGGGDFSPRE